MIIAIMIIYITARCYDTAVPGLELPPGMPGISSALVTLVPGTAVAKDIPAGDTIIPG